MDTTKLLSSLKATYPHLKFTPGKTDSWSPEAKLISYRQPLDPHRLLHEIGHAVLGHKNYQLDIELLKIEVDAWVKAQEIAPQYGLTINQTLINDCLETYKRWLLKQSLCPQCQLVGIQADDRLYSCPNCQTRWSVPLGLGCAVDTTKR